MKLLFICTHNRCRSILAEAISNHVGGGRITAVSAGSSPQGQVHPLSLKYLDEHQVPTDGLCSQSWNEFESFNPDAVLTLCASAAKESCPIWFGDSVQVFWGLTDPSKIEPAVAGTDDVQRASFNNTIDILTRRINALLESDMASLHGDLLKNKLEQIATEIH